MLKSFETTVVTPRKWPGTRAAAKFVAQAFDRDVGDGARGIHFFHAGSKNQVHAVLLQQFAIAIKVARILGQVFVGAELERIDEDRNHDQIALRLGRAHQRQMALVQRSHGGHQGR